VAQVAVGYHAAVEKLHASWPKIELEGVVAVEVFGRFAMNLLTNFEEVQARQGSKPLNILRVPMSEIGLRHIKIYENIRSFSSAGRVRNGGKASRPEVQP
jgi:hypothetical protein